jgi:hypothetical protein
VDGDVHLGLIPGDQAAVEPDGVGLADGHDSSSLMFAFTRSARRISRCRPDPS